MIRFCQAEGCETLTFGPLCLDHEPRDESRRFPRGRPYLLKDCEVTSDLRRIDESWPLAGQGSLRLSLPS